MEIVEFESLLGSPLRRDGTRDLEALAESWNVAFPQDLVEFAAAYGDSTIARFLHVYGPRTMGFASEFFDRGLPDWDIPGDEFGVPLLPSPSGMLLWASSVDGDMLCLRLSPERGWLVSVSLIDRFEWRHFDLAFSDWLYAFLAGEIEREWHAPWPRVPHSVVEFSGNPFGVEEMGPGPAGSPL